MSAFVVFIIKDCCCVCVVSNLSFAFSDESHAVYAANCNSRSPKARRNLGAIGSGALGGGALNPVRNNGRNPSGGRKKFTANDWLK